MFDSPADSLASRLAEGIAEIGAALDRRPVIVRSGDFKANGNARMPGGEVFEPHEENPMIGFRRASRCYDDRCCMGFALECEAIRRVRDDGLRNFIVMIPFCRPAVEAADAT